MIWPIDEPTNAESLQCARILGPHNKEDCAKFLMSLHIWIHHWKDTHAAVMEAQTDKLVTRLLGLKTPVGQPRQKQSNGYKILVETQETSFPAFLEAEPQHVWFLRASEQGIPTHHLLFQLPMLLLEPTTASAAD